MEATVLDKELARLDRELEKIYLKRDKNREGAKRMLELLKSAGLVLF